MKTNKIEELRPILVLMYSQGTDQFSKEAKATKTYGKYKKLNKFRKIIDQAAKERNYDNPFSLIDYFCESKEHKEELIKLLKKKRKKM